MGGALRAGRRNLRRDDLSGKTINIHGFPYRFHRRLGAGAFGAVYSAQAHNGMNVAVKVIDVGRMPGNSITLVESYLTEVRHLERLRKESNHVVRIFDFDFDSRSGRAYIVMELGGDNLTNFLENLRTMGYDPRRYGTYVEPTIRKGIWTQLVAIVETLTRNGIVHMDLKPDNLIVFGQTIKIADLGIAKKDNVLGSAGVGTPQYSAPEIMLEQYGGRHYYGPKADIWSLGAILYYMTYGQPPQYHRRAAYPPKGQPPTRDRALQDILRRTLALNPHNRADIFTVLRHPYTNY